MRRVLSAVLVACLVALPAAERTVHADDAVLSLDVLRQQETDARALCAAEMTDLQKFCEKRQSYDEARLACAKALIFSPDDAALKAEAKRLEAKKGTPRPIAATQIADHRAKKLARCSELLAPVALAYAQAQHGDELARLFKLLGGMGAPLPTLDIAFFEPYLEWRSKKDAERLAAGEEYLDGAWLDAAKVAEVNAAHADWAKPWVVTDEATEVRTTLPYRTARQVLARAAEVRRNLVQYFAGEWELKATPVRLRIDVTSTRAQLDARLKAECPNAPPAPPNSLAYYVDAPGPGNPCFACFESLDEQGKGTPLDFEGVRWAFQHEFAHQVAFEYSKYAKGLGRLTHAAVWAIEGLAEFAPYLGESNGTIAVKRPSWIPSRGREVDSAFGWCRTNVEKMPPLEELSALTRLKFLKEEDDARVAATLVWFLLEGNNRARRKGFVKYLEKVHQDKDEAQSLSEALSGLSLSALDGDFRTFVRSIRIEEK